jgi:hypothetical protein
LTEFTATDQQMSRVVVLDFITERQIIVHDEKSERIEDMQAVTSPGWADGTTLRIGTASGDLVERVHTWKAS